MVGLDFSGINLVGYLSAEIGLGEAARSTFRAAKAAGIEVSCVDFKSGCSARFLERIDCENSSHRSYAVNLFHLNPDQLLVAYVMLGKGFFDNHFNIIYCVWEQREFPDDWRPAFELIDEVWTPSTFCANVIGRRIDKPVIPIPHNVEPVAPEKLDREALGLPKEGFLFLGMLDCYSTPERKNPLASLEAYVRASTESSRESYFVLKVLNSHAGKELMSSVKRFQARCPRILVIDQYLSRGEVSGLMHACDCFVSLHRCEGFGLTLAEAMYLGKPVIATGWSGNMDFMNERNSLPVRYELVELKRSIGPYRRGYFWAEPDVDHAAALMRRVMDCPEMADSIGKHGREEIKRGFSASKAGQLMRQRLREIGLVFSAEPPRRW